MDRKTETNPDQVTSLMEDLDGGVFSQKAASMLRKAAIGVSVHGKPGKVTLEFAFKRIGESMQVQCIHTATCVKPSAKGKTTEVDTTSTPLYVNGRGQLSLFPNHTQSAMFEPEKNRDDSRA